MNKLVFSIRGSLLTIVFCFYCPPAPSTQCNNPLTKEPKLASAMRIAPEWTGYDQEVRLLQERVAQSPSTTPPSQGPTDPTDSSEPSESTHDHQEL